MEREMEHMTGSTRNKTEDKILVYLREREAAGLPSPTIEEIRRALGIGSTSTVRKALTNLENAGKITWIRGQSRSVRVVDGQEGECRQVPVMAADGRESGRFLMIDSNLLDDGAIQAVPGNLFIHSAIGDCDYAVINTERAPQEGNLIATREEEGFRLRRFHPYMLEAVGSDDPLIPERDAEWPDGCQLAGVIILTIVKTPYQQQ